MKKRKISRLYAQIIASFLGIILLAMSVLMFVSVWFTSKNEKDFLEKAETIMENSSRQMNANIASVYTLSDLLLSNQTVKDNLRLSSSLTAEKRYHYQAIIGLLEQAHIQMDDLISSMFLYMDDERILYSAHLSGMAAFDTFFDSLLSYENHKPDFWKSLLSTKGRNYIMLEPDEYVSFYVNSKTKVIPLIYHVPGIGGTNILVTNLSCEAILDQYRMDSLSEGALLGLYTSDGAFVLGDEAMPDMALLQNQKRISLNGQDYFVFSSRATVQELNIYALIPVSALTNITSYYRVSIILLWLAFIALGITIAVVMSRRAYAPIQQVHDSISSIPDIDAVHSLSSEIEIIRNAISQLANERELYRTRNDQYSYHYIMQGLATLLDGRHLNDERYFSALLSREYHFEMHHFRCVDVLVDALSGSSYLSRLELLEDVQDRLQKAFEGTMAMLSVTYQSNMLVLLLDSKGDDESLIQSRLDTVIGDLKELCSLRIGLGNVVESLSLLPKSFESANSRIFAIPVPMSFEAKTNDFVYERGEIYTAANTRDIKRIEDVATDILTRAKQAALPYAEAVGIVQDIRKTVVDVQRKLGMQIVIRDRSDEVNPMEVLILSPAINITPLITALLPYIPYQKETGETAADKIAYKLRTFIDEHYSEELSLDILADKMGVSSKYLSRVFKQVMGMNLSDYLSFVRVEKIKELLLTDAPLNQIMEGVGIFNRTTFTRMFRRQEGISPSEYRSLHKSGTNEYGATEG
ncbi:MAG: helix-turn-helix domain-containing protein [Clostridia bacterium]|nr:helix-turn-helix domain-containing protein [Clostridia bacterium]